MEKECQSCHKVKKIVNSHYRLCDECNKLRLKSFKASKLIIEYNRTILDKKPLKRVEKSLKDKNKGSLFINIAHKNKRSKDKILKDELFYEQCFNNSDHKCEECDELLPDNFRNSQNKVEARWRYSHIIPKSIAPELRHDIDNINHLCLKCHGEWENGNKVEMRIFSKNYKKFPNFLNRLINNKL